MHLLLNSWNPQNVKPIKYEQHRLREKLDAPILCHHCNRNFDNHFADFKRHLDEVWTNFMTREQAKVDAREKFFEQDAIRKAKEAKAKEAESATKGDNSPKEAGSAEEPIEVDE